MCKMKSIHAKSDVINIIFNINNMVKYSKQYKCKC